MSLTSDLDALSPTQSQQLQAFGWDRALLLANAASLSTESNAELRRKTRNRVQLPVRAVLPEELLSMPAEGSSAYAALAELGWSAIEKGELAFLVMAGGMATRMGGIVKALAEVLPATANDSNRTGKTFLDLRLAEQTWLARRGRVPLWLMTSDATEAKIRTALADAARARARAESPAQDNGGPAICTFTQSLSLRLTPEGQLFRQDDGSPSAHATGHGDVPDAIRRTELLTAFCAQGGKYVWIANVDNLGATVDPAILGMFIQRQSKLMVEVCPKRPGDRGGIPVHVGEHVEVLEEFRLPEGFDPSSVQVFNTNTFLIGADTLRATPFEWTYFEVEKWVEKKPAIQFERLLQEMTHHVSTQYLKISRDGTSSRFLPVKDTAELDARRIEIAAVLAHRGIISPR